MDPLVILGRAKNESNRNECVYFKLLGQFQPSQGYIMTAEATDLKTVFISNINLQDILNKLDEGGIAPSDINGLLGWISTSFENPTTVSAHHHQQQQQPSAPDSSLLILSARTKAGVTIELPVSPVVVSDNGQNTALLRWVTDDILSSLYGERDALQKDLSKCREEFINRERKIGDVLELLERVKNGEKIVTVNDDGEAPGIVKEDDEKEKEERTEGQSRGGGTGGVRGRGSRGPLRGAVRGMRGTKALRGRFAGGVNKLAR